LGYRKDVWPIKKPVLFRFLFSHKVMILETMKGKIKGNQQTLVDLENGC